LKNGRFISIITLLVLVFTIFISIETEADTGINNDVNYSNGVIYQVMTDRFYDGDTTNNPSGELFSSDCSNLRKYCGGDWQGLIQKINSGYLTNMGVTAIWISSPVENIHETLNDTAVIDFVPNHTSPASEDDPTYAENGALYDNGTYIASYSDDPNGYFHHNGGTDFSSYEDGIYRNLYDLADFNLQSSIIDQYLKDSIQLWLDRGVDGIRVDAVKHMPQGWQQSFMDEVYSHKQVFTFGEWFLGTNEVDPQNHYFANESGENRYGISRFINLSRCPNYLLRDRTIFNG